MLVRLRGEYLTPNVLAQASLTTNRLSWKALQGSNTLACPVLTYQEKRFISLTPVANVVNFSKLTDAPNKLRELEELTLE